MELLFPDATIRAFVEMGITGCVVTSLILVVGGGYLALTRDVDYFELLLRVVRFLLIYGVAILPSVSLFVVVGFLFGLALGADEYQVARWSGLMGAGVGILGGGRLRSYFEL